MRPDPLPVEGPVELIDGRLVLRIPFEMGGMGVAALALGIGRADNEHLNVEIQPWLAQKLGIAVGSIVVVSIDTVNGNFSIIRSAGNHQLLGERANTWGLSSSRTRTRKRPAVLKASPVPVSAHWNFTITTPSAGNDTPSGQSRNDSMLALSRTAASRWLASLNAIAAPAVVALLALGGQGYLKVCLPTAAVLFGLTAAAHWWRWPLRWLLQSLAIAVPVVIVILLLT